MKSKLVELKKKYSSLGVDPLILQILVALDALGFPTTGSCEGHANKWWLYPWVVFVNNQCKEKGFKKTDKETIRLVNLLNQLLREFYKERCVPSDQKLEVHFHRNETPLMFFSLKCHGADVLENIPPEIITPSAGKKILARHQKEMAEFCKFLQTKLK